MARLTRKATATLADLAETGTTGLLVRCLTCAREKVLPMADLMAQHGRDTIAVHVAERMTCSKCGGRPAWWWERTAASGAMATFAYPKN